VKETGVSGSHLTEAVMLYRNGRFDEAAQRYQQLLETQPRSAEVYAGLARVYLKQKKLQQARETLSKGLMSADTAVIHVALGEILFREGKLPEAETEWLNVVNSGHSDARAHLGLARLSAATARYKQAKKEIDEAHKLDPGDPDIQTYWNRSETLNATPDGSPHNCRLTTDLVDSKGKANSIWQTKVIVAELGHSIARWAAVDDLPAVGEVQLMDA